jgi:hypothetical protein
MPRFSEASYGGETVVLENQRMRVEVHKRTTGWGWAEIFTPEGKLMGVLPHFSELQDTLGGQRGTMIAPRRLEAPDVKRESTPQGESLVLQVHALINYDFLKGSFLETMANPAEQPILAGQVRLTLEPDQAVLHLDYRFRWQAVYGLVALRGPWLLAGANSYGQAKTDAIFPGIEWLRAGEWSSSQNDMLPPFSNRTAPHPFKVSAPLMAVSHDGIGIGLAWEALQPLAERRPLEVKYYPQPVFSSPDAVYHADRHLMGLMIPSAVATGRENDPMPHRITPCDPLTTFTFKAEIFLAQGTSLDVFTDWVERHGLPEPSTPRRPLDKALEQIAQAYDSNLWIEGKGWGMNLKNSLIHTDFHPSEPAFMRRYLREYGGTELGRSLAEKFAVAAAVPGFGLQSRDPFHLDGLDRKQQLKHGRELLAAQRADGAFPYEPQGRHASSHAGLNHLPLAQNLYRPLGMAGDTALDLNAVPALELLRLAELTSEQEFKKAAYRALDYCLPMLVPDGGDWWETPLHSPNLLSAGHAAIAYELAYQASGEQRYRTKAIYWLRALLTFTHLWEPLGVTDLYCTKPCLCATDWVTNSWVDTHVQWEVVQSLALAGELGIDWVQVDPAIDWHRYAEGIASAATHWILDKSRAAELPYSEDLALGNLDGVLADAHDPITGQNWGMQLEADYVALLLMDVLERSKKVTYTRDQKETK